MSIPNIKEVVREKYGEVARSVTSGAGVSCCSDASALQASCDPITSNLYDAAQEGEVPDTAIKASLGCGNPTALAELKPGEIVLDLSSGGGIDVLLSARRVGPTGKAYGLDMTDDMLALAEENKRKSGLPMSSFSKAKSRISTFPIILWMSSSRTASSTFQAIRIACSKKRFGCSNPAVA
jgi:arsenite methyltransferase